MPKMNTKHNITKLLKMQGTVLLTYFELNLQAKIQQE